MKTMKWILVCCTALTGIATAREGQFGLGLSVGDPTGITGKYWMDELSAVDAAASWSLNDDRFTLHADYLRHEFGVLKEQPTQWAFHYGLGARVEFAGNDDGRNDNNNDATLGLRVPLGFDFYPTKMPLEIFIELAPVVDLIPDTDFDIEFGVGARFYFK